LVKRLHPLGAASRFEPKKKGINKMEHKKENLTKTIHYVIGKLFFSILL
jgi:hypothetical protein